MTPSQLTPRELRTLVAGGAVIAVLFLGLKGVPSWRSWRDQAREDASRALARAAETESVLAAFPNSVDSLEARSARLIAMGAGLIAGDSAAAAAASLAALLGQIARTAPARIDMIKTSVVTGDSAVLPRVVLEAQVTADIAGLAGLLRGLERGPRLLAIRRLQVQPDNVEVRADQIEMLTVRLKVEGLALVTKRDSAS